MIKYCLPIIETNEALVWGTIRENISLYHYFEVWLDYIDQDRKVLTESLAEQYGERMIFLFRRKKLEKVRMPVEERFEIIDILAETKSYLDLDLKTQQEELGYLDQLGKNVSLICSYHNYNETPDGAELRGILSEMKKHPTSIYKISSFCNYREDVLKLLAVQMELSEEGDRHIILGMGEEGAMTRIFGTLWGNEMIFAPLTKEASSAPGQLTRDELETCFRLLE